MGIDGRPAPTPGRRRGRPQRLPVDGTPVAAEGWDGGARTAWLLATSRRLSGGEMARRSAFIERLHELGYGADPSRVSRWESGQAPVDATVIGAYESALDLPPGVLLATTEHLRRRTATGPGGMAAGPRATNRMPRPLTDRDTRRLDEGFSRIDAGVATGADWLQVTTDLGHYDRIYLHATMWERLCDRIVAELTRASGPAYILRSQAIAELARLPVGRRQLSRSIGRFVMDPAAQRVAPALSLLGMVSDGQAGDLVLRLLSADRPALRRGAAEVAGPIAALDQSLATGSLEGYAVRALGSDPRRWPQLEGLDLLTHLPDAAAGRIIEAVRDRRLRERLTAVRTTHELAGPDVVRSTVEATATAAEAAAADSDEDPDQMLRRLLREALFHARRERRHLAAITLAASPYAAAVGAAVLELTRGEAVVATSAWSMLRRLGHVSSRADLATAANAEKREAIRSRAVATIGLGHGPLDDALARDLARCAETTADADERESVLVALGLAGHAELDRLAVHRDKDLRLAAEWWQNLGPALHELPA